ncbi:MAG: efflux RND transporter periplasmic adaptor subunit [Acidobacteria bacterium]|nr:efflux RND transporter periplasmic adaptor subunit [Acidobacteriota bacterium]
MTRSRKRLVTGGTAVIAVGAAVYGFSGLSRAKADFDPSRLAVVERGTMLRSVVATGKIEPIAKVEIKSKANGIIEGLRVDVGDIVTAGDVLAELDKEMLRARVREALASLQGAQAGLKAAEAQIAKNTVEAEGPDVAFARRAYDRASNLFSQKLLPQSELDSAQSTLELAENRMRAAQSNLAVARAKVSEATASVAQARATLERAEEELANATIRAPIRGTVLTRDVEIGSPVSSILNLGAAASLVMTLGDIDEVFVRGKVDEVDIGRVRLGQAARITVETFKDRVFDGSVTEISPIGVEKDNVTNFEVKISIRNPGKELKANMTANAEIILERHPDSLIIPEAAVTYDTARNAFVEVPSPASPNGRRKVAVKLGIGNGTKTQVLSGLREGEKVLLPL